MRKTLTPVRLSKTASNGTRWQIWDSDLMSSQYHGCVEGYATKQEALDWIRSSNASSLTTRYRVVK